MIRFRFVDDHRTEYSVKRMCAVLKIHRSSYYAWRSRRDRRDHKALSDALLGVRITEVFRRENGCYGAKRITAELNDDRGSTPLNHKRVARIMKDLGLYGYTRRRRVKTTVRAKGRHVFTDLVRHRFYADRLNKLYVGDITYLPIADGSNMYLATVLDCCSRRLVGFAIADHMKTSLVIEALNNACATRRGLAGSVFHSDHGSVYTSDEFKKTCSDLGVTQSMGSVGTSADNAFAESFNSTLKREVLQDRKTFANQLECRRQVFRWCARYNTSRRHSWCGNQTPNTFEEKQMYRVA